MDLTRKIRLYPNKVMSTILDNLCDYRRYCWNQALDVWMSLYQQRQEHLPADLRLKVKQAVNDKSITFTDDENALLIQYPAPTRYQVCNMLVATKEEWQYLLSSRVLQQAVADLAKAWKCYFNNKDNTSLRVGKTFGYQVERTEPIARVTVSYQLDTEKVQTQADNDKIDKLIGAD